MKTKQSMNRSSIIIKPLAVMAVALAAAGCRDGLEPEQSGRTIVFKSSSTWQNALETKTAYGGDIDNNGVERIDWVNGDKILIWSDKASTETSHDHSVNYKVSAFQTGSDVDKSEATIEPADVKNGLQWGEGAHKFLCMYPSPAVTANIGFYTPGNPSDRLVNITVPGTQGYTKDGVTLKPDMKYAYMYASATASEPNTSVTLSFKPMFTAFQFTVDSREQQELTITSFSIQSATKAMSGSCRVLLPESSVSGDATYEDDAFPTATDDNKKISVTFSGTDLKITRGTPMTFTVFALPQEYNDLSVSFTTNSGDVKTLKLTKSGTGIEFKPGHKYNIKGLGVPGEWVYVLDDIDPITVTYLGTADDPLATPPTYSAAALNSVKSYKYKWLPETPGSTTYTKQQVTPVPFKIQYSADGSTGWEDMSGDSFPSASWIKLYSSGGFGGSETGVDLTYNIDMQTFTTNGTIKLEDADADHIDLSTYNVATGKIVEKSTANCYVVDRKGTFKFPAVYGNGILHGKVNMPAFHRQRPLELGASSSNYLVWFQDHADTDIMQPYIALQPSVVAETGSFDAVLVWENVDGLIDESSVGIEGSGENMYIHFEVPGIAHQGNAMIALRKGGKIVWSWHIWCYSDKSTYDTGARPRALKNAVATPNGYKLCPVNLGWCDLSDYYAKREGYIRVVWDGDREGTAKLVKQVEYNVQFGAQPHYVWGRKDPVRGFEKLENKNHPLYYKGEYYGNSFYDDNYKLCVTNSKQTLGWYIQHPYVFCIAERDRWCTESYLNLWNSSYLGQTDTNYPDGIEVTKTIYDPCPVGYKVPSDVAFKNLAGHLEPAPDQPSIGEGYGNFWRYYNNNTPDDTSDDIYFPASGYRISKPNTGNYDENRFGTAGLGWVGTMGFYYTAHNLHSNNNPRVFYFGRTGNKGMFDNYARAWGRSIRPMVDPQAIFDVDGGVTGGHDIDRIDSGNLGDWR